MEQLLTPCFSAALALQAAEETSALQGHAHVSLCVQSRRRISASIQARKAKGFETEREEERAPPPLCLPTVFLSQPGLQFHDQFEQRGGPCRGAPACSAAKGPTPSVFQQWFSGGKWELS